MRLYFDVAVSRWHTDRKTGEEPRVVRIAWWADDKPAPVCRLIRPLPGMTIDPSTVRYHGLTVDDLRAGADPAHVIAELEDAAKDARTIVSFNGDFHWRNLHRLMGNAGAPTPSTAVCAMKTAEVILALPAMRPGGGIKSPSLVECCEYFGVPKPVTDGSPFQLALSTVAAVRAVYEACLETLDPPGEAACHVAVRACD